MIPNHRTLPIQSPDADICLIVEGCYPYVSGGVSSWIDWLLRTQPELRFAVVSIVSPTTVRVPRYPRRRNLLSQEDLLLQNPAPHPRLFMPRSLRAIEEPLIDALIDLFEGGGISAFARINSLINGKRAVAFDLLISSEFAWKIICRVYERVMPHASFLHFYWAWRALLGGLFATLKAPIPKANVYHTISTGYAGLLAARASLETGRPAIVTEHGIYTNERRIEILMADWISDTVNKGMGLDDERTDLRDLWIKMFDAYALVCYQASRTITTLYQENQLMQVALGAAPDRLRIIANGIDLDRFDALPLASADAIPTIALIGRVVPIKDVKTFIAAIAWLRERIPDISGLILGPIDEDPAYYAECVALVDELELQDSIRFTGPVDVTEFLSSIHVVVLTSLSEAQPLVLLEAGAAGVPCVTTNVGSCREVIEGTSDEAPELGPGGYVVDLVAPEQIGAAVQKLLAAPEMRRRFGANLKERVRTYFSSDLAQEAYRSLYDEHMAVPDAKLDAEFVGGLR